MNLPKEIISYNNGLPKSDREIASELCLLISKVLPKTENKLWHGHPVWLMNGNPIVGYSIKKSGFELLFWSGQSFANVGLKAIGKFKAAALAIPNVENFDPKQVRAYLKEAKIIQWDYKNLPKYRKLEKLTDF